MLALYLPVRKWYIQPQTPQKRLTMINDLENLWLSYSIVFGGNIEKDIKN